MFGLLYFLGAGTAYLVSGVKASYNNAVIKEKAIQEDAAKYVSTHTYMDRRGATRDISTNALRCTKRDEYDDVWLTDQYLDPIRNLSSAKRAVDAAILAAKAPNGTIAVKYNYWNHKTSRIRSKEKIDYVSGQIYKDIETGELYLKRRFYVDKDFNFLGRDKWAKPYCIIGEYYMRLRDGMLQCLTENMRNIEGTKLMTKEDALRFMEMFNKKQKEGGYNPHEFEKKLYPIQWYYCCDSDFD